MAWIVDGNRYVYLYERNGLVVNGRSRGYVIDLLRDVDLMGQDVDDIEVIGAWETVLKWEDRLVNTILIW